MPQTRSREELLKFLDYVRAKGLMSPNTAESRKASVNKVLGILSDEEADDVTALDLDQVISRFGNLHGKQYTPESLRSYRSRVKSSIEDFKRYVDNPMAFKPSGSKRKSEGNGNSKCRGISRNSAGRRGYLSGRIQKQLAEIHPGLSLKGRWWKRLSRGWREICPGRWALHGLYLAIPFFRSS